MRPEEDAFTMVETGTIRDCLDEACPGIRVHEITELKYGRASQHWVADTDEGPLLVKVPVRNRDPEHFRHMIAATRVAAEHGLPVIRFRAFLRESRVTRTPLLIQEYVPGDHAPAVWEGLQRTAREEAALTLGRWIGDLHAIRGKEFADVFGRRSYATQAERASRVLTSAHTKMAELDQQSWPQVRNRLEARFAECGDVTPVLCHNDLYLDNVVLRDGRPILLLDFEHANYSDQYTEFGKIGELLFGWWPETEEPFLSGYQERHPLDEMAVARIHAHAGLYNVQMCIYFARYEPTLVPVYLNHIKHWIERDTERE